MKDVVILIPAYNPSGKLIELLAKLIQTDIEKIIIVNDGSDIKYKKIFETIKQIKKCIVLEYKENHGKGYALKHGIKYYLKNLRKKYKGLVTVDADYQHLPNDIINISKYVLDNQYSLILGVRNFNLDNIPFLNKYANKLTSKLFELFYKTKITDTQTGLRGISNYYLNTCLDIKGDRFEYEMHMLIYFSRKNISIKEVEIETIYYKEKESKFKKIKDSIRIYKVLFKERK